MACRPISLDECYAADEALVTCTSYCIAGVRQINGTSVAGANAHPHGGCSEAWSGSRLDMHQQVLTG